MQNLNTDLRRLRYCVRVVTEARLPSIYHSFVFDFVFFSFVANDATSYTFLLLLLLFLCIVYYTCNKMHCKTCLFACQDFL